LIKFFQNVQYGILDVCLCGLLTSNAYGLVQSRRDTNTSLVKSERVDIMIGSPK
jgi:hypothetical protein